jgi:hypothetical protein
LGRFAVDEQAPEPRAGDSPLRDTPPIVVRNSLRAQSTS